MGSIAPNDKHSETSISGITETVAQVDDTGLVESIADVVAASLDEAAGGAVPLAELHGGPEDEEHASVYWDALSMAPLNAVSAVSVHSGPYAGHYSDAYENTTRLPLLG
jgi:hypothetical protein